MDRLESLAVFVAVAEQGGFAAAARRLRRSPAAVTRAVAALENRLGTRLLTRTTRSMALTDAGQRYLDQGRRALAEFAELENAASAERGEPSGLLTITASEMFGRIHILPIVQSFMREFPRVEVLLLLLNRVVSLVDEGIDVGVRIAHLPDSSLRATQIGVVRRVACASPDHLDEEGEPQRPQDLQTRATIVVNNVQAAPERWSFGSPGQEIVVPVKPRLVVSGVQAGLDAAVASGGFLRPLSYQSGPLERAGLLRRVLTDYEPPEIDRKSVV